MGGTDPVAVARAYRTAWGVVAGAALADALVLAWAASTWLTIARLERDEVQMADIWTPAGWLYELGGRFAAMAPFALLSLLATIVAAGGALRARELKPYVTREALRQAALADQPAHPFLREVDETGSIPRRTLVLGAVLLLLLAGTAAWVISQR